MTQHNEIASVKGSPAPKNVKTFGISNGSFVDFDNLINQSGKDLNAEYSVFFSNSTGTQHGCINIAGGCIIKTIPLVELNIISVTPVETAGDKCNGYLVKYCNSQLRNVVERFISCNDISKKRIGKLLQTYPQSSKKNDELCERLLTTLITGKAKDSVPIIMGSKQGWNVQRDYVQWESNKNYPETLKGIVPESIACRETAKVRNGILGDVYSKKRMFSEIFSSYPELRPPLPYEGL